MARYPEAGAAGFFRRVADSYLDSLSTALRALQFAPETAPCPAPAGGALRALRNEVSCPICLEYLAEPVLTECGHVFCRPCIHLFALDMMITDSQLRCPECRSSFTEEDLRPVRPLQNIVPLVKELERQPLLVRSECQEHNEQLRLFCRGEEGLICTVCSMYAPHRAHDVLPLGEAYDEYKADLQDWLEILKKEAEKLQASQRREEDPFRGMIFLGASFSETPKLKQISTLMTEIETKCQQPAEELLKDVRSILNRCGNFTSLVTKRFAQKYKALVTLDPDTAHRDLILSEDDRRVRRTDRPQPPDNPRRFRYSPCVLGREEFTSGRHYWEINGLNGVREWGAVGVAGPTVKSGMERLAWMPYFLLVRSVDRFGTLSFSPTSMAPRQPPLKLGVYLDYEGGRLSFYNADTWEHLHTINDTFTGGLRPFFRIEQGTDLRLV